MQAWTEAEKSMSSPSCFLTRSQESSQAGKFEYFVPLQEVSDASVESGLEGSTLKWGL